eukprot:TRINITY_DN1294_c0_g2_i1.p1 TRINITY_DN1294_c0_g2~~TRINITY_DN1294_c0_g2_i1.p1  ORF type:complete len:1188 (-),score=238.67 TRINITY_DN1294_c0_g2_i1:42-3605(-)
MTGSSDGEAHQTGQGQAKVTAGTVKVPPIDQAQALSSIQSQGKGKQLQSLDRIEAHLHSLNRQIARFFHVGGDASLARREAARARRQKELQLERSQRSDAGLVDVYGATGGGMSEDAGNFVVRDSGTGRMRLEIDKEDEDEPSAGPALTGLDERDELSDAEEDFVYPRTQEQIEQQRDAFLQQQQEQSAAAEKGLRNALFKAVTGVDDARGKDPTLTGPEALQAAMLAAKQAAAESQASAVDLGPTEEQLRRDKEQDERDNAEAQVDDLESDQVKKLTQTHTFAVDLVETLLKDPQAKDKSRTFLLEDLQFATQWEQEYQEKLGPLRDFLEAYDHLFRVHENKRDQKVMVWLANHETELAEERVDRFTVKRASKWLVFKERQRLRKRLEELVNTEDFLIELITNVLKQNGSRCVKIPSLAFTLNWKDRYSLRYGDIKSFLRRHWKRFSYGELHGHHDMVWLKGSEDQSQLLEVDEGMILDLKSLIRREYEENYRTQHAGKDHRYHARIAADDPNKSREILRKEMEKRVKAELAMYNEYFIHERAGLTEEDLAMMGNDSRPTTRGSHPQEAVGRGMSRVEVALAEYDSLKEQSARNLNASLAGKSSRLLGDSAPGVPHKVVVEILGAHEQEPGPSQQQGDGDLGGGVFSLTQVALAHHESTTRLGAPVNPMFNPFHQHHRTVHAVKLPADFTRLEEEPVALMNQLTDNIILSHVIGPARGHLTRDKRHMREMALSKDCGRVLRDAFWYIFVKEYRAGKYTTEQQVMYSRAARNFVSLFLKVDPRLKDRFFVRLADVMSQSIFSIFWFSFPDSRPGFDQKFLNNVITECFEWITGGAPTKPADELVQTWPMQVLRRVPHTYSRRLAGSRASTHSRSASEASGRVGRMTENNSPEGRSGRSSRAGGQRTPSGLRHAQTGAGSSNTEAGNAGAGGNGFGAGQTPSEVAREERRNLIERATMGPTALTSAGGMGVTENGRPGAADAEKAVPSLQMEQLKYRKDYGIHSQSARSRGQFDLTANSKLIAHFLGEGKRPTTLQKEQFITHSPRWDDLKVNQQTIAAAEEENAKQPRRPTASKQGHVPFNRNRIFAGKADASVMKQNDVMSRMKSLREDRRRLKEAISRDAAKAAEDLAAARKINADGVRKLSNDLLARMVAEEEKAELERGRRWGEIATTRQATRKASNLYSGTP